MSELRRDPLTGDWTIIATERAKRPEDYRPIEVIEHPKFSADCPFCPGNEAMVPLEVDALRPEGGSESSWLIRVIPNKFPMLTSGADSNSYQQDGTWESRKGFGCHEVIIESPVHNASMAILPDEQIIRVIEMYQRRLLVLAENPKIQSIYIFKPQGRLAGTSLIHSFTQIIGFPIIFGRLEKTLQAFASYAASNGDKCVACEMIEQETKSGKLIIATNDYYVALVPFASRSPFQILILPTTHQVSLGQIKDDEITNLALILKECLKRLYTGINNPDYNLYIYTLKPGEDKVFHWYLEIHPCLTESFGMEKGTGVAINTTPPEEAAKFLRAGLD